MSQDNSKKSKEIIKLILKNGIGEFPNLTAKQKKVILESIPEAIKGINDASLIQNNQILGKDKRIYKINYNAKSKWVALSGMQRTITTILSDNKFGYDTTISPTANFLLFIEKFGLDNYLKYMFESITEVDQLLIFDKDIKQMYSFMTGEFDFQSSKFESNILQLPNIHTWYVRLNGVEIFQIQAPASNDRPNSHILRVNVEALNDFYKKMEISNETWGISVEVALCQLFSIEIPKEYNGRSDANMVIEAQSALGEAFVDGRISNMTECLATKRKGAKKSSTDFMAGSEKISVKSNFNNSRKVCPPEIGQPGISVGLKFYNSVFPEKILEKDFFKNDMLEFKTNFQENIAKIVSEQVRFLFSEDAVVYVRKTKQGIKVKQVNTKDKEVKFDQSKFTFTKSPKDWKESVSISYDGISLAEMQLHKNRSPFKFRFNFDNLLRVIENIKK